MRNILKYLLVVLILSISTHVVAEPIGLICTYKSQDGSDEKKLDLIIDLDNEVAEVNLYNNGSLAKSMIGEVKVLPSIIKVVAEFSEGWLFINIEINRKDLSSLYSVEEYHNGDWNNLDKRSTDKCEKYKVEGKDNLI